MAQHQTERPVVETIFFGGGTPSLMEGRSVGRVLQKIAALWPMGNDVEITLEANPASADAARFADYRAAGVNRVSLGVQALNDPDLKKLGRLHDVAEAKAALKMAMGHFDRVSLDLIYARPDQSEAQWRSRIEGGAVFRHRSSLALPAHHRAGDALRPAAQKRAASDSRTMIWPPVFMRPRRN